MYPSIASPAAPAARPTAPLPPLKIAGFDLFKPDPALASQEQPALISWNGNSLPFIEAEGTLPVVDLPAKLVELIKHCWTAATADKTEPRSNIRIGTGARTNHIPNLLSPLKHSWELEDVKKVHNIQQRNAPYAKQVHPLQNYPQGLAAHLASIVPTDWKAMEKLPRVKAYTFRGDTRGPKAIEAAGGLHPPVTRKDASYVDGTIFEKFQDYMMRRFNIVLSKDAFQRAYNRTLITPDDRMVMQNFLVWRSMVENEALHLGRMLHTETLKGYISTTRAVPVAKSYAHGNGWVYLTLVRGGFLVPEKGKHAWTQEWGEQEIAFPGSIPWDQVFGFRQLREIGSKFTGPIYMRQGFAARNPDAFNQAYNLLSGQAQ